MGVEIPEKSDYGHEDADIINAKNEILGEFYNLDHPRTKRMSMKITQDECSRALGAECNDYDYRPVQGRTRQDSSRVIKNYVYDCWPFLTKCQCSLGPGSGEDWATGTNL